MRAVIALALITMTFAHVRAQDVEPVKGAALGIPAGPRLVGSVSLPRFSRLDRYASTQRVQNSRSGPHSGPIVHEGVVEAPLDQVWTAFTTSEGLRAWLAPHAEIDLRIGGLMRTNYNPDGQIGDAETIENAILSFEPQRMISIKVARPPANFPFPNAVRAMWTVMYFSPAGPARTSVREVTLGFTSDPESQRMRAFFEKGNATTLGQLQRHFSPRVQ